MLELDIDQYREEYPEFSDTVLYSDRLICRSWEFASNNVNQRRWRESTRTGVELYTAHLIVLAARDAKTAAIGGTPGSSSGPLNTKTVGSVTANYDTQQTAEEGAGWWNLTTYGKEFFRLSQQFGMGAIQLW